MAVINEVGPDAGLVWHHGNPVAEQRAMEAGRAVVRLSNRDIVEVSGPDRLDWLHSLTTQALTGLRPGASTAALVLSPTGHLEHGFFGVDDGERLLAWTEPGRGQALVDWLTSMRFMMRVEVGLRPDLELVWAGDSTPLPQAVALRASEIGGRDVFVPRGCAWDAFEAGTWAYEALRIAAGVPRLFIDTDARTIPNEIGLLGTHLDKGCYRGQETVARVHTLGRPPRRLVQLHLDGSVDALPALGSPIEFNGRASGFVGGSARHHELGPIALGLVKRNVPVDAPLIVDGIAAAQTALVDPEVGLHFRATL